MEVVCIDSKGFRICDLEYSLTSNSLESKNWVQITSLQDVRPAQDADFTKLPILHEGFLDSHMHPSWMAKLLSQINLNQKLFFILKMKFFPPKKKQFTVLAGMRNFTTSPWKKLQNSLTHIFHKTKSSISLENVAIALIFRIQQKKSSASLILN